MEFVCRRCTNLTTKPYRVTTEDGGVILLNMLVCPSCARLAKSLGLPTVKVEPEKKAAETRGIQPMTDSKHRPVQPPPSIR
jgi:hypothetical protein